MRTPEQIEEEERELTRLLLAQTQGIKCEGCRWEIVRTGGVVSVCDEHKGWHGKRHR